MINKSATRIFFFSCKLHLGMHRSSSQQPVWQDWALLWKALQENTNLLLERKYQLTSCYTCLYLAALVCHIYQLYNFSTKPLKQDISFKVILHLMKLVFFGLGFKCSCKNRLNMSWQFGQFEKIIIQVKTTVATFWPTFP